MKLNFMRNIYLFYFVFLLISCELKEIPFMNEYSVDENTIILMDDTTELPEFNINSFDQISSLNLDNTCYFALTQNAFADHQYIYAFDAESNQSYMQLNGHMISIFGKKSSKSDSLFISSHNDSLALELFAFKIDSIKNRKAFAGEIEILLNGVSQFKSAIYAECEAKKLNRF